MKAIIKKITHGKYKGQYRFHLTGINHEILVVSSESYTQKHNVIEVLKDYFEDFELIDKTGENGE